MAAVLDGSSRRGVLARGTLLGTLLAISAASPTPAAAKPEDGLIVFESDRGGHSDIWIMEADGSNPRNLTNDKIDDLFPTWSRDGKKIAWTRGGRDPSGEIWIMNLDGSGKTQVTSNGFADYNATWSLDGSRIIFQSPRVGGRSDLFSIGIDGTGEVRLTDHPASDIAPDWSPDGSRVAFASNRSGHYAIYTMDPDGSDVRKLTEDSQEAAIPGWSPDGARILYVDGFCATCGESDLFTMNPDGSGVVQVTDSPENEASNSWSRDGSRCIADLADVTRRHLAKSDIAVIDLATGATTNLTGTPGVNEAHPRWSPVRRTLDAHAPNLAAPPNGDTDRRADARAVRVWSVGGNDPTVFYSLPRSGPITLRIFDIGGREVASAASNWQSAGTHRWPLALKGQGSQVLFYRLEWEGQFSSGRLIVVR